MQYKSSSALDYFPFIILLNSEICHFKEVKCIEKAVSWWYLQKHWFKSHSLSHPGLSGGDVPAAGAG